MLSNASYCDLPPRFLIASLLVLGAISFSVTSSFAAPSPTASEATVSSEILDFDTQTLAGEPVNLSEKYDGKVVLLVNVASKCGYTRQYTGLQKLHEQYADRGLAIVGVPCNQFGGQEPGTADEIAQFCSATYGVEFDMLAKANVKASKPDQSELYARLTSEETNSNYAGDISWNFEKFLFDREGNVIGRYKSGVEPNDPELIATIEAALAADE